LIVIYLYLKSDVQESKLFINKTKKNNDIDTVIKLKNLKQETEEAKNEYSKVKKMVDEIDQ